MTPGENEGEVIVRFKEAHSAKEIILMSVCGVVMSLMSHRQDGECLPEHGVSRSEPILRAKVSCAETAVHIAQELMTILGGTAFAGRLPFQRYFRDARTGIVMALANGTAYQTVASPFFPAEKRQG
jgi:alkylation response protein AidB-like acyl-CoA dehydrogenase